jgi:hypothetical protein
LAIDVVNRNLSLRFTASMKYQLVLQMPFATLTDYYDMIRFEGAVAEKLGALGGVDGHDAGSGEMNIYLFSDDPGAAFDQIKPIAEALGLLAKLVAAYREIDGEEYVVVYPPGRTDFAVA